MLCDIELSDAECDKRIRNRSAMERSLEALGLLQGPTIGTVNMEMVELADMQRK